MAQSTSQEIPSDALQTLDNATRLASRFAATPHPTFLDGQALIRNYIRPRSVSMILLPRHNISNNINMATGIYKKGFLERVK